MQSRTLLFGQGLFETILCIPSELKLILHYQRLSSSARALGIPCPSYEEFEKSVLTSCAKNRGLKLVLEVLGISRPNAKELSSRLLRFEFDHKRIDAPMRLCTLEYRRHSLDPISKHKTTNYLFNLILKEHANKLGFDDCIILNQFDEVCETTSANILFLKGGTLFTPDINCGLLPGTTLKALSKEVKIMPIRVKISEINDFDAVFTINSLNFIRSVEQINGTYFKRNLSLENELNATLESLCLR